VNPTARLVTLSALRWVPAGLVIPVQVLLLTARGLSLAQVGQVIAVYGVTTLLMELPTGGLADSWGRRPVVVASALVQAVAFLLLAVSAEMVVIFAAVALAGMARALSSGPVEAWFVDISHSLGIDDIEPGLAKGQMAEALALGAGSVVGGLIPALVPLAASGAGIIAFSVPYFIAATMGVVYAAVAAVLLTSDGRSPGSVGKTVGTAIGLPFHNAGVRRVVVVAALLGVVLSGVELISPDRVADLVGSSTSASAIFGVLTASAFVISAFGAWLSTRLRGRRAMVGAAAYAVMGVAVFGLASPWLGMAALTYLVVYLGIGIQGPVMAGLLHGRVDSSVRATMLSVESLALQFGGALASVTVGWLVTHVGLPSGLALLAAAAAASVVVLLRDLRHITCVDGHPL
jgi:predicted MFS family arabinose efflux permease